MFNVAVIEDEELILNHIAKSVQKNDSRFRVVYTTDDPIEFLNKIPELDIDVMLTDIYMPQMDGLELIERVKEYDPSIIPVIISGYADFEMAKKAIKLDVEEYILKPFTNAQMQSLLNGVAEKIIRIRNEQLRDCFMSPNIEATPETLPFLKEYERFGILTVCVDSFPLSAAVIIEHSDFRRHTAAFEKTVRQTAGDNSVYILETVFPSVYAALICFGDRTSMSIDAIAESFMTEFIKQPDMKTVNAACADIDSAENILPYCYEIINVLSRSVVLGKSRLIKNALKHKDSASSLPEDCDQEMLMQLCRNSQKKPAQNEMKKTVKHLFESGVSVLVMRKVVFHIIDIYCHYYKTGDEAMEYQSRTDSILYSGSTEAEGLLLSLIDELAGSAVGDDAVSRGYVSEIKKYIDHNYAEQLSLQQLAALFNLSESYIIRLFKRYENTSPNQYITSRRIEKACYLMKTHSEMSIKDIGASVGYSNQYYFSRVFKSVVEMTATDYRAANADDTDGGER